MQSEENHTPLSNLFQHIKGLKKKILANLRIFMRTIFVHAFSCVLFSCVLF